MNVYFENSHGEERLIGIGFTKDECYNIIDLFLDEHEYKSYYKRSWETDRELCVDVGSHSEFFYIREESKNV